MRMVIFILFVVLIASLGSQSANAAPTLPTLHQLSRISVQSIGEGKPVVLIPGLATPRDVWSGIVPELAKRHRVLLVQVNGFGSPAAEVNRRPGTLDGIVEELAAYLSAEKLRGSAVIGHSMGGLIGTMLATRHPEAVGRLMVVDALPFYGALMGPGATPDSVRPIAEQMRAMLVNGPAPTQAPPGMSSSEAGRAKVLSWLKESDAATVGEAMVEDATTDVSANLPKLAAKPITILYAVPSPERAELVKALYGKAYAGLPTARLVPVADSAHFIMLDQPAVFAAEVKRFLP
ncbi:alpha/beta hydrolase [Sphingomonas piscis]|uniref:Alpha/beta hydrolase n=1 Tax=Sphingomonas piscis TaxID=2714943 RepID=A0A6G7YP77_9SPHN|nr:alpha/beta hydrolase [Sphingomonas piscis]QIK78545.1 alpha/beta hydrolase [Sphingomonas piscis]